MAEGEEAPNKTWEWEEELQRYTSSDEYISKQIKKEFDAHAERLFSLYRLGEVMEKQSYLDPRTGKTVWRDFPRWTLRSLKSLLREFIDRARFRIELGERLDLALSDLLSADLLDKVDWKLTRDEILKQFEDLTGLRPVPAIDLRRIKEEELRDQTAYIEDELKKYPIRFRTFIDRKELDEAQRRMKRLQGKLETAEKDTERYRSERDEARMEKAEMERRRETRMEEMRKRPDEVGRAVMEYLETVRRTGRVT